ncbi:MAG TPA: hypothetical protein VHL53_21625 [Acidimicrobiia bacterium]|nr:hypothetical protein [Acidimicrobiia bacterium]
MTRPLTTAALAFTLLAAAAGPALADRRADTTCAGDGCEATARGDQPGHRYGGRSKSASPITCQYKNMRLDPTYTMLRPDGSTVQGDGTGQWYERQCFDTGELARIAEAAGPNPDDFTAITTVMEQLQAINRQPVYLHTREIPSLVEEARSKLVFPPATPRFAPSGPWTFVNYPTALWLDGDLTSPRIATAEAPGVRVTVTATPEQVQWDTGDGDTVVCAGPGRAPDPSNRSDHGDCSHVWSWPSAGQPDGAYRTTATVFWHVTWTAEGAPGGGDLGLVPQRSQPVRIPVAEVQALNTPTGP